MPSQTNNHWMSTLAHVEQAIQQCVSCLDRYEKKFEQLLASTPGESRVRELQTRIHNSDNSWNDRLRIADTASAEAEELFAEHEQIWSHWINSYDNWARINMALNTPTDTVEA